MMEPMCCLSTSDTATLGDLYKLSAAADAIGFILNLCCPLLTASLRGKRSTLLVLFGCGQADNVDGEIPMVRGQLPSPILFAFVRCLIREELFRNFAL